MVFQNLKISNSKIRCKASIVRDIREIIMIEYLKKGQSIEDC